MCLFEFGHHPDTVTGFVHRPTFIHDTCLPRGSVDPVFNFTRRNMQGWIFKDFYKAHKAGNTVVLLHKVIFLFFYF